MTENWLGKPIGQNKPHNFFKSNSKIYHTKSSVANMFKDSDGDGVANVFDCKPHNKNKQGFIDAIVGAVKGLTSGTGVRKGFTEGMAMKGNPVSRAYRQRQLSRQQNLSPPAPMKVKAETKQEKFNRIMAARVQAQDLAAKQRADKEFRQNVSGIPGMQLANQLRMKLQQAHPLYAREMKQKYWQQRLKDPKLTPQQRSKIMYQMAKAANVRKTVVDKFRTRAVELAFPVTSMSAYGSGGAFKTIQGVPGRGRGRPRGSLDRRYAAYGGVFGYRRFLSEQRKIARARLQQQQMMMKQQRVPQYESQQYQGQEQQLPPELQGQGVTPEYSQFQQEQAQMQEMPQQVQYQQPQQITQPEPQQREIATVFKGSGGSPYPPVSRVPLAQTKQTIPYGYVESVDAFTGRRFLKQLPKREGWTQ